MVSSWQDYARAMEDQLRLPFLIVEARSGLLVKASQSAERLLKDSFIGTPDLSSPVLPFHQELSSCLERLKNEDGFCFVPSLFATDRAAYGAFLARLQGDDERVLVILCRANNGDLSRQPATSETVEALNKQIHFERLARQLITKV